jgi:carbamoyl-phosphate synthase large subunit
MFIVFSEEEFRGVVRQAFDVMPDKPVLIDKFLEDAIELDVDCISDGETSVIGGMLEHIEFAGVHSGDAAMVMPPHTLSQEMLDVVRTATHALARELKVVGLMNVQFAIKDNQLYILEVNPRASRTVPFVAKAIGLPLAKLAAKVMVGVKLKDLGFTREQTPKHWCVKEAVFPFVRFPGATITLGPEMRSTGEVMGLDDDLGVAFAKAQAAAKPGLPTKGNVFLSVKDGDKARAVDRSGDACRQNRGGPPNHGRHDQERSSPDGGQYAGRDDPAPRRKSDPVCGLRAQRVHHDHDYRRLRGH